jgi:hypothetical protein
MLLELQVYFYPDDYDPEIHEGKPKMRKAPLIINTDHITAFHEHDSGGTMIRLSNGDVFQCTVKFSSFREIIEGLECSKDMFVSGTN